MSGALPDRDGGREAVDNVVRPLGKATAAGPGARLGHEVLPGLFIEFPAGEGRAARLVVDGRSGVQLTGDGHDEFVGPVLGLPDGSQSGCGGEPGQDLAQHAPAQAEQPRPEHHPGRLHPGIAAAQDPGRLTDEAA